MSTCDDRQRTTTCDCGGHPDSPTYPAVPFPEVATALQGVLCLTLDGPARATDEPAHSSAAERARGEAASGERLAEDALRLADEAMDATKEPTP